MIGDGSRKLGRMFIPRGIWAALLLGIIVCGAWRSQAQEGTAEVGLRGILPGEVPEELTVTISLLPETWTPWGEGLTADLQKLYESEAGLAEQEAALQALRRRVATVRRSLADPRYRSITSQLVSLDGALTRRLDIADTVLATVTADPATRADLQALVTGLEEFEAKNATAGSTAARAAFDRLRATAPKQSSAAVEAVLRKHYLNYNMRVVASEDFLNKLVAEKRQDNGPVADYILGAQVSGNQTTVTNVTLDLLPRNNAVRFDLVVNGQVNSNTSGTTSQATVFTQGNHVFTARKAVSFDGNFFSSEPARIGVNANNYTYGAQTRVSRLPILGGIADRIAMREAEKRRGESESIAAGRVQDRVLPELNTEVDKQFSLKGTANKRFHDKVVKALKDQQLYPDAKQYRSTDTHMFINTRLMAAKELGAGEPLAALNTAAGAPAPGGVNVQFHESLFNNSVDRMNLAGRTLTEDELRAEIEQNLSQLLNRKVSFIQPTEGQEPESEKAPLTLSFDSADPIRIRMSNGQLLLTVRAAFKQEGKEPVPGQIITVPLEFSVKGKQIVVERGDVSVKAVTLPSGAGVARQISMAGVIKRRFETALPPRQFNAVVNIEGEGRKSTAIVTDMVANDGWLSITLR